MNDDLTRSIRPGEKPLAWLEQFPMGAAYRVALGWLVFPLEARLWPGDPSLIRLAAVLLGVLVALKLVPGVLRRLMPVSQALREHWFSLRVRAKQYDSYQWRKLFWIGLGMLGAVLTRFEFTPALPHYLLAGGCLVSGGAGLMVWRSRHAALQQARRAAAASRSPKSAPARA